MTKIDLQKIPHSKIKAFIVAYALRHHSDFEQISAQHYNPEEAGFKHHFISFSINKPLSEVWEAYKSIPPQKAWAGKMVGFALMYRPKTLRVYYPSDSDFPNIESGQMMLLQLHFLGGLIKLPVGHMINRVEEAAHEIETSYLEFAASRGSQVIRLVAEGTTKTRIEHETWYTSNNWFRDKVLYPPLHSLVVSRFHANVANYINRKA